MKRIVCLSVLLVMCLVIQPLMVFASEPESGTWGDNITWEYEDGVLTFSGVGEMDNSSNQNLRNWLSYSDKVTKVVVEEGITKLTSNFIQRFELVTTVSLPEGLTAISGRAFSMCSSLTDINIPTTVTAIMDNAFYGCSSLKEIQLPDGLQYLDMDVFWNCTALESITIPESVTFCGTGCFNDCTSLKSIYFQGDAPLSLKFAFRDVTATVYYPIGNATWTEEKMQVARGDITWKTYCPKHTEKVIAGTEPGCTTTGLTEGKVCKYCDEVLQAQEVIPATGIHTFGEWKIVDSSEEGVLVERSCETCGHTEQKLLDESYPPQTDPSDAPTNPEDTPAEPTDTPTEPTQTPTDAPTEPTQAPTDPTQPDITVTEDPKPFPWAIVVIAVVAAAAAAAGILLGRKRK